MKRIWRGAVLGLFFGTAGVSLWADDPLQKDDPPAKKDGAAQTPAEKFAAAKKVNDEANAAMNKVVVELQKKKEKLSLENKELNAAYQARNKTIQAMVKAAEELVKAEPTTPAGFEALTMIVNFGNSSGDIIKLLDQHHAANPKIGPMLFRFSYGALNKDMETFLNHVIEKNPNKDGRATAAFTLASLLKNGRPEEAEKLFEKIKIDYKDVQLFGSSIVERADANVYEVRHLQIGKVVPEIEGEDMDGKQFKLSDYRGKVVMLDFWGHW